MKKIILLGFLSLPFLNIQAEQTAASVLAEYSTFVGFAPPKYRGLFKFQLLSTGTVQKVDNKNKITFLALISKPLLNHLIESINRIENSDLEDPVGPICMDAPSNSISVKSLNRNLVIWKRADCRESPPKDTYAQSVAAVVRQLEEVFSKMEYL